MPEYLEYKAEVLYKLEMDLRTFIIEHDIQDEKLAQLLGMLPVGVEVLWASIWKDGNGYTEHFSGGERYTITLETIRHLNIVRCLYCGHSHPVGKCSCDK